MRTVYVPPGHEPDANEVLDDNEPTTPFVEGDQRKGFMLDEAGDDEVLFVCSKERYEEECAFIKGQHDKLKTAFANVAASWGAP